MIAYAWQDELISRFLSKNPTITRPWIRKYNHNQALSSNKAKHELGYTITPFDEGMKKTIDWIKSEGHYF